MTFSQGDLQERNRSRFVQELTEKFWRAHGLGELCLSSIGGILANTLQQSLIKSHRDFAEGQITANMKMH